MRYAVILTPAALNDLRQLRQYVEDHDGAQRADQILTALETTILHLETHPERGNAPKELRALGLSGFRELHYKPYRIIYRTVESQVIVYCILDGRRDMQTLLQQRLVR
ncbi:MAG TPA: type II toxin-antitoxin system RelE/ParE family toxin [Magnetospirillaceae bacterium]|jgi:toxin ParE1/3/4